MGFLKQLVSFFFFFQIAGFWEKRAGQKVETVYGVDLLAELHLRQPLFFSGDTICGWLENRCERKEMCFYIPKHSSARLKGVRRIPEFRCCHSCFTML